jgi:hypothetical protein
MPLFVVIISDGITANHLGSFDEFKDAYKIAITQQMREENATNRWHIMMYDFAKNNMTTSNPLKVAFQEPTPNPEDEVNAVYIVRL